MVPLLILWVHLLAAIAWIGGMLFIWVVLRPALLPLSSQLRGAEILKPIEDRFKKIRWISLVILVATGVFNLLHEGDSARLESTWGGIFMIKLLLVAIVLGLSGVSDFVLTSDPATVSQDPPRWVKKSLEGLTLILGLMTVWVAIYLARS